jgi:hypothetical protein
VQPRGSQDRIPALPERRIEQHRLDALAAEQGVERGDRIVRRRTTKERVYDPVPAQRPWDDGARVAADEVEPHARPRVPSHRWAGVAVRQHEHALVGMQHEPVRPIDEEPRDGKLRRPQLRV